ncbi:hypothetical protein [Clostridium thermarum]|uniref:hypothetical protein n=1 Tax=Clostridium thermarum TaxID=1716543 RepID=UPI00111F9E3F|nr:hypothetical protein [Clostridium thermarum]
MNFKYDFRKIAKSISDGAATAAKKSTELYEISKLNLSIQAQKRTIKDLEEKIGHIIYKRYRDKGHGMGKANGKSREKDQNNDWDDIKYKIALDEKIIKLCKKIDEAYETINSLNKKIERIKKVRICGKCGLEIPASADQCPYCNVSQDD